MTSTSQPPSEMICVLPPQLLPLGEALAPVANATRHALVSRVRPSGHEFAALEDVKRHLDVGAQVLAHLSSRLDSLMTDVIHKDGVSLIEIGRSAGRLEQVLSELVDGYHAVKATHAVPESAEARTLMLGIYQHHILNVCDWLDDLVATIADPALALQRLGIEPSERVELTVTLNMTSPPEMAKLDTLIKQLQSHPMGRMESLNTPVAPRTEKPPGLWSTIGALVFGFSLYEAASGKNKGEE